MMQKIQRFGGAMFVPVLLFSFAGIVVGISTLFTNETIIGSLAAPDTFWYKIWYVIQQGGWTVFNQIPLIFVVGLPIALAKQAQARACLASLVTYLTFNYFVSSILTFWGSSVGVNMQADVGGTSGLANIAGIKTLDTNIIGAILVASIVVFLHNKYFDKKLPEFLGIFQGTSFVVIVAFIVMLPLAFLISFTWPLVQNGINSLQAFLIASGGLGVWLYTFLERILIPTGLHHFIYSPFVFGPAVVNNGIAAYWAEHLNVFSQSADSLKNLFPEGGFALHGNSKIFGIPGIALAMYVTAKKEKKKMVAGLLIPAVLTAIIAGVTEPIEFTFLFISPVLFAIHAVLAATMATTMFLFGVVGNMGGGLIELLTLNWIPLFHNHATVYIAQMLVGLSFTAIYFFVFRFLILRWNILTPGREANEEKEAKLYSKKEYKEKKQAEKEKTTDAYFTQALLVLDALGGASNIVDVTNCATRLRVSVADETLLASDAVFKEAKAMGVVRNGKAIQVIIGLSVPQVRERFEKLIK